MDTRNYCIECDMTKPCSCASSYEEVGKTICELHERIQTHDKDWQKQLERATGIFNSWLLHPLGRNWALIEKLKEI